MKKMITLILIAASFTVFSQTTEGEGTLKKELTAEHEGWKTGGIVNLNFSQSAFSKMWPSGGTNSMTLTGLVSVFANFSDGANVWDSSLDLGYGFSKIGSADAVKSEDKIDLTSKYGRKAFSDWYYAGLLNFKSQMTPTEIGGVEVSEFLSPGALLFAVGMDYKPGDNFSAFISPVTYKADMVMNDDFIAVDPVSGDKLRDNIESQIGGYMRLKYKQEVYTDITYESKFEAFSNYDEDPQNMYLTWDNLLTMKVNEYLNANVSFDMINTPGLEVVYKEVLGIGLSYKF